MTYTQGDANYNSSSSDCDGEHQSTTKMRIRVPASRLDQISQQSNDRHCRTAKSWEYPVTFRNGSYPPPTMAPELPVATGPSQCDINPTLTNHNVTQFGPQRPKRLRQVWRGVDGD